MDESKTSEGGKTVGNLAEPMEGVEAGSTSEDVMVEVLGSDVFVDGVRSHEDDDEIDAVVSVNDKTGHNNETTGDDMDIDSKLPNDSREPLGVESKDTDLVNNVGISETGVKEIPGEEGGPVVEASVIVVEETQLIDGDNYEGLVEETRVVVDEKKLINVTNDEVENPLEDDDLSHRGKTEVCVEAVVDASSGCPVDSNRPTGGSTTPVQEQDGSESAAAAATPLTTKLVPNQKGEEQEDVNGVACHPSLVLETPSSLGEDNLNPEGDSVDVSPIPEENTAVMQSGREQADVSVLEEEVNTEEPSLEAPVSVEGDVKKIKEDTEGSSVIAVSNEEIQTEDKLRVEDAACSIEEADDGLAADSEQPTQIVMARKTVEVDEETISSTCPIDQDSKPEGHLDSKMDDSADDVEAASLTGQKTEANMEVVTGSSENVEQTQEAIKQEVKKPPQNESLKHHLNDITYPIKNGRSMEELMSKTTNNNDDDQRRNTRVVMNATAA